MSSRLRIIKQNRIKELTRLAKEDEKLEQQKVVSKKKTAKKKTAKKKTAKK